MLRVAVVVVASVVVRVVRVVLRGRVKLGVEVGVDRALLLVGHGRVGGSRGLLPPRRLGRCVAADHQAVVEGVLCGGLRVNTTRGRIGIARALVSYADQIGTRPVAIGTERNGSERNGSERIGS